MVMAHVTDAWTRPEDRDRPLYGYTVLLAGMAAPLFLFLAGLTLSLAASARAAAVGHAASAATARWRGVQIFALAFLFRLQSQLLGWGPLANFLKVDILNVMGLAMVMAALLWGLSARRPVRLALFALATAVVAMSTPLVREMAVLAVLPDPIESYLRPLPGLTTFALFPWAGFLLGGAMAGELIYAAATAGGPEGPPLRDTAARRLQLGFLTAGAFGVFAAYALSFQPSIYPVANFWTSSPTFFFIRLGLCTVMLPLAWSLGRFHGVVIPTLGRSSLFVYWIHVEIAYGVLSRPIRRALPIEAALLGTAALCAVLYALVVWKNRRLRGVELTGPWRVLAPILK